MRYPEEIICPRSTGDHYRIRQWQRHSFHLSPMFAVGLLGFVMIMEASSELLHHESSAKALLQGARCHDLFAMLPRKRVHNNKTFRHPELTSLRRSESDHFTISSLICPPLCGGRKHYYPNSHAQRLLRAPLIHPALQSREWRYALLTSCQSCLWWLLQLG
jgi:hypothetical protein